MPLGRPNLIAGKIARMSPIPTRVPPPAGMPSRDELRKQMIRAVVEGQARQELAAEKRAKELADRNRPPPSNNGYQPVNEFKAAADRLAAIDEFLKAFDAQCAAEEAAAAKHFALRRRAIRNRKLADQILSDPEYLKWSARRNNK